MMTKNYYQHESLKFGNYACFSNFSKTNKIFEVIETGIIVNSK